MKVTQFIIGNKKLYFELVNFMYNNRYYIL